MSARRQDADGDSLPYVPEDRRSDTRHGRQDGRKQIPTYTDLFDLTDESARVSTPYQEQLVSCGLVRINEEYEAFVHRTTGLRQQLARSREQLEGAEQAVARARDDLAAAGAQITDTEMLPRNHQELALTDEILLRSRREMMRERRIAAAHAEHERRIQVADRCRQEIKETCARIDHEFAAAQAAGRRIGDYYVLRIATYWDALVQKHPEGRHLASRLPAILSSLPPWVDGTCVDGVITLPPPLEPSYQDNNHPEAMPA
ncbi:hypothetical protein [Allorhizocola rhizosphaerae]|uniref:hypothetical protein n=1 Tax=Allorhizocola rhizosphaerae TaxID=1872709 RepID=UPI000E3C1EF7|nr:hypothetical protein [Allorhizocola rhizosphaerae]